MFVFLIYRIKSCSYSYPNFFSRTWWMLNIYKKKIVSKSNGKFDSVITWALNIPVSSLMMFIYLGIGHICVISYDVYLLGHWTYLCHLLWCLFTWALDISVSSLMMFIYLGIGHICVISYDVYLLGHWTYLCHLLWCLSSYIILIYCISPKFISGKKVPVLSNHSL
jgi:hypothetical protein